MIIQIDDNISLESLDDKHASEMFSLIDTNRSHLREWLPWVDPMQSLENMQAHITDCKRKEAAQTDFPFAIFFNNVMAGRIGIHYIHQHNKTASIGYWLAAGFQGKGIMKKSCVAVVHHCFDQLNMHRVQIKAATGNIKSQAIPEKLNFTKEGILREAELVNEKFLDLYMYSMLKEEWKK